MTTILGPLDLSAAVQTGPTMFRKQLLRKGTINYPLKGGGTRKVVFDDAYILELANAFKDGAYDNVAFILADATNAHTMAPERFRGWLKGVEVTPDGLDGILELSADAAQLVAATGGKLGVSPRIRPVDHIDGRHYDKAINHVLGTLDARQQGPEFGLRDWEPIDLSADPTESVLDLSGATYQEGTTMPEIIDLSKLTDDQAETLRSFAALHDIDLSAEVKPELEGEPAGDEPTGDEGDEPAGDDGTDTGDDDEITDAELDALIDAELANVDLAAGESDDDLDLAAGQHGTAAEEAATERKTSAALRFELAARDYVAAGIPPHIIDLAEPILSLSDDEAQTLDLSSPATGEPIDVRGIVRDMLDAVKGTIDLAAELGHGHEAPNTEQEDATAKAWIEHLANN